MFDQDRSKYAFVLIHGDFGYGHLEARIWNATEITWNGPKILISSQIGPADSPRNYGEEFYAERITADSNNFYGLTLHEVEASAKVLKKIDKKLTKLEAEIGSARTFPDYLYRALIAAQVEYVIVNKTYGGAYSCKLEEMPRIDMSMSWAKNDLRREIDELADVLIKRFCPRHVEDEPVQEEKAA